MALLYAFILILVVQEGVILPVLTLPRMGLAWFFAVLLDFPFLDRSSKNGSGGLSVDFETWLALTLSTTCVFYGSGDHRGTCFLSFFHACEKGVAVLIFFTGTTAGLILCDKLAAASSTFWNSIWNSYLGQSSCCFWWTFSWVKSPESDPKYLHLTHHLIARSRRETTQYKAMLFGSYCKLIAAMGSLCDIA